MNIKTKHNDLYSRPWITKLHWDIFHVSHNTELEPDRINGRIEQLQLILTALSATDFSLTSRLSNPGFVERKPDNHKKSYETPEISTAVKIQVEVLWIVTPCSVAVGCLRFGGPSCVYLHGVIHGSFPSVDILPHHYTLSQLRRHRLQQH
jgi:hypothetical protein